MTATKPLNLPLPLEIKREKAENTSENDESEKTDDDDDADNSSVSSLLQPSILDKDFLSQIDPQDEFLHLTSLVRRVYFSYLHKSIINNYNVCTTSKNENVSRADLKKISSRLELHAVKASLQASLYRQTMLQIISDIKDNTKQRKVYKKLAMYLNAPPKTSSIGVQTYFETNSVEEKNSSVISDIEYSYNEKIQQLKCESNINDENFVKIFTETDNDKNAKIEIVYKKDEVSDNKEKFNENMEKNVEIYTEKYFNNHCQEILKTDENINTSIQDIFGNLSEVQNPTQNNEEESRDSLIQHLEDMFCESDDSSDLTTLIEKHSGIIKSNIDSEISKMCGDSISLSISKENPPLKSVQKELTGSINTSIVPHIQGKRKLSFSNYKRMKKRAQEEAQGNGMIEDRQTKKMSGIWFVERVHQVSKLKAKMMELAMRNYRKHGRLREKFFELFGESDEQEMMPDSPIHIEEHLTSLKERIAPWVVKYLMPYYTKKVIEDRLLFKAVAKHIADMLIIENTFPEEDCVNQYIQNYFRNKPCIKLESDIYI